MGKGGDGEGAGRRWERAVRRDRAGTRARASEEPNLLPPSPPNAKLPLNDFLVRKMWEVEKQRREENPKKVLKTEEKQKEYEDTAKDKVMAIDENRLRSNRTYPCSKRSSFSCGTSSSHAPPSVLTNGNQSTGAPSSWPSFLGVPIRHDRITVPLGPHSLPQLQPNTLRFYPFPHLLLGSPSHVGSAVALYWVVTVYGEIYLVILAAQ